MFRGNKLEHGPKRLKNLPRWFDDVHYYFPTDEQAKQLNITNIPLPTNWVCDRITRHQVIKTI